MKNAFIIPFLSILFFSACIQQSESPSNAVPALQKEFISQHNGYSEAVSVVSGGLKTIYISGQIGEGETFEQQMRSAITNMQKTLKTAGASMQDVVKMNTYIVDYKPELLDTFRQVRKELMGDSKMPASTLVGVGALALDDWQIEIEAVAVVEAK